MSELEAVLGNHVPRLTWVGTADWTAECLAADCDWRAHGAKGGGVAASDAHRTHLADVIRGWAKVRAQSFAEAMYVATFPSLRSTAPLGPHVWMTQARAYIAVLFGEGGS